MEHQCASFWEGVRPAGWSFIRSFGRGFVRWTVRKLKIVVEASDYWGITFCDPRLALRKHRGCVRAFSLGSPVFRTCTRAYKPTPGMHAPLFFSQQCASASALMDARLRPFTRPPCICFLAHIRRSASARTSSQ
jgi:hypothetical protein